MSPKCGFIIHKIQNTQSCKVGFRLVCDDLLWGCGSICSHAFVLLLLKASPSQRCERVRRYGPFCMFLHEFAHVHEQNPRLPLLHLELQIWLCEPTSRQFKCHNANFCRRHHHAHLIPLSTYRSRTTALIISSLSSHDPSCVVHVNTGRQECRVCKIECWCSGRLLGACRTFKASLRVCPRHHQFLSFLLCSTGMILSALAGIHLRPVTTYCNIDISADR